FIINFLKKVVEDHKFDDHVDPTDFVGAYQRQMNLIDQGKVEGNHFNYDQLVGTIGDLFIAGHETTVTTLQWLILYLLHFLEIQKFSQIRKNLIQHGS